MATLKRKGVAAGAAAGGAPAGMHVLENRMASFKARKWPHGKDSIRKVASLLAGDEGAAALTRCGTVCRGGLVPRSGRGLERLCQVLHVQQGPGRLGKGRGPHVRAPCAVPCALHVADVSMARVEHTKHSPLCPWVTKDREESRVATLQYWPHPASFKANARNVRAPARTRCPCVGGSATC